MQSRILYNSARGKNYFSCWIVLKNTEKKIQAYSIQEIKKKKCLLKKNLSNIPDFITTNSLAKVEGVKQLKNKIMN